MKRLPFGRRLHLAAAGIDFLLNHPKLKFTEFQAGMMILRHTVLFGKLNDTMTLKQLSEGVRNLNRGTGRTPRRLSVAVARLVEVGFLRVSNAERSWRGKTFELCADNILEFVKELRKSETVASAEGGRNTGIDGSHRNSSPLRPSEDPSGHRNAKQPQVSSAPTVTDAEDLKVRLNEMQRQLAMPLPPADSWTCSNLLVAARHIKIGATLDEIVWFVRNKVIGRRDRFRSWGGVVTAVREDFA